ncbi:hydrolase [Paraoerskovia sediminicola]|uniref:Hydrolase n=1 Tax=Paraoerskovia sediminicola TaxID=1138587 RepID=A0ABN6XFU0_9CELL|nr:HAD-IA family hydrolase [Paraoerskovia sediminicola]BDZ43659.1 hydrolase [Paraoerskovia sediminicola]
MTADSTIDTVLYDLGQVLVRWEPSVAMSAGVPREAAEAALRELDFAAFNHRQDEGRTWRDAIADLRRVAPQHVAAVEAYVAHFPASLTRPVEGSEGLVDELDDLGLRLFGLTNWSAELFWAAEPAAPAIGRLRDVLVSGEVGVAKPDPRIFGLAVERFGLVPARTVFVDDSEANVAAAAALGFRGLVFTTTAALRSDLRALGIAVGGAAPEPPRT